MNGTEAQLETIRALARRPDQLVDAEKRLYQLIESIAPLELAASHSSIRATIEGSFLPKRRALLRRALDNALFGSSGASAASASDAGSRTTNTSKGPSASQAIAEVRDDLHQALVEISDRHLFQWPHYEAVVLRLLEAQVPRAMGFGATATELSPAIREELAAHTSEVLKRGYRFATERQHVLAQVALERANSGTARLLDIGVNEYRRQLDRLRTASRAEVLRRTCSAWLSGILCARLRTTLGTGGGAESMLASRFLWVHLLPFLCAEDLERVLELIPANERQASFAPWARPLSAALDEQAARATPNSVSVLRSTSYSRAFERLEVALVEPISGALQEVAFHCYLNEAKVRVDEIESAVLRGMQLILLPVSDEVSRWAWRKDPPLTPWLVDTSKTGAPDQLRHLLNLALSAIGVGAHRNLPLKYNYARRFPLDRPDIGAEYRVSRVSVRQLLEQHHAQNGVRVWCSVRRSGKTTACADLLMYKGPDVVITETCERTGTASATDSLYQAVGRALERGEPIEPTFVAEAIRSAADYDLGRSRIVYILDEYESLFRRMEAAALRSEDVRYKIVQPLLNQLLAFSESNLVILLGLRPDAHFILMDQNQLSPYVKADQFPLFDFQTNRPDCEFRELVRRVLTDRVSCDDGFTGHLFSETGGHPVLTVNVLCSLCDWLIERETPSSQLQLTAADFDEFASERLTTQAIGLSDVFDTHRKFAQQGLSIQSRERTPWLYAVLHVLRELGRKPAGAMSCSVEDVVSLLARMGLEESLGIDAHDLVRGGAMANFFRLAGTQVRPRIRLYARLATTVTPTANA